LTDRQILARSLQRNLVFFVDPQWDPAKATPEPNATANAAKTNKE
jgi:hypothetical protein